MRNRLFRNLAILISAACLWQFVPLGDDAAHAVNGWQGKRRVSYQAQKDLFYNYYVSPRPMGTGGQLYVSPRPVPPFVGHTYTTYQPLMPHEYLHGHQRAYYTYNRGAGWTRTNVRYGTCCGRWDWAWADIHYPMSLEIMGLNNSFYHPGLRF